MVNVDRSYNLCNCFAVYAEIVRRSAETFDIKYDTHYLYYFSFQIYNMKIPINLFQII